MSPARTLTSNGASNGIPDPQKPEENPFSLRSFLQQPSVPGKTAPKKVLQIEDDEPTEHKSLAVSSSSEFDVESSSSSSDNGSHADSDLMNRHDDNNDNSTCDDVDDMNDQSPQFGRYLLENYPIPQPSPQVQANRFATSASKANTSAAANNLTSGNSTANQPDLQQRMKQLEEENSRLQREVEDSRKEFLEYRSTANKRIGALQKELTRSRKKEIDDTRQMEEVVRMVEENLHITTNRALKAENQVQRLRDENRILREESVPRSLHNRVVREHAYTMQTVKHKSRDACDVMRTAAEKTEPHLRQLVAGLSTLRFLADQFDDLGKIADLPDDDSNDCDL